MMNDKKSDIVREAVREQDWKKALQIAKDFRIGVTQEQRNKMARAYECIVHPDFYRQIGVDIPEAIEQGKAAVKEYAESTRRKNTTMKWDVKHDIAKGIIDRHLTQAEKWSKNEKVKELLTEEELSEVGEEVKLMIASIRKRYKLDVRLPQQAAQIQPEEVKMEIPTEKAEETFPEPIANGETAEKPKRTRKTSTGEKKTPARKPRAKKENETEA